MKIGKSGFSILLAIIPAFAIAMTQPVDPLRKIQPNTDVWISKTDGGFDCLHVVSISGTTLKTYDHLDPNGLERYASTENMTWPTHEEPAGINWPLPLRPGSRIFIEQPFLGEVKVLATYDKGYVLVRSEWDSKAGGVYFLPKTKFRPLPPSF